MLFSSLKAVSLLERSTIVAKRCQVKFLQPSTINDHGILFSTVLRCFNHPCNFDTSLVVKLVTAQGPYGRRAQGDVSWFCNFIFRSCASSQGLGLHLNMIFPSWHFGLFVLWSILKKHGISWTRTGNHASEILSTMQHASDFTWCYKYQQTGNSYAGCKTSEFHTRNDIGPQKISPYSVRPLTPGISLFEQRKTWKNHQGTTDTTDTSDGLIGAYHDKHDPRTESTTSLLPIQPAMSTRIFTGDVAHQSWDMKQPWQEKNKASHKSCDH